jgi:hypothetical protein
MGNFASLVGATLVLDAAEKMGLPAPLLQQRDIP